ncbi:MAG: hypothetical protein ACLFQ8_01310 [Candidatus Aenigmatarchaeota archaeon]
MKKGMSGAMLIIVFVIIIIIITGSLGGKIIGRVGNQIIGKDVVCPTYCDIQASIEGHSFLKDRVWEGLVSGVSRGKWGNPVGTDTIAQERIADFAIDVESAGCYCGVSDRQGKYIHSYVRDGNDDNLGEFHLTDQHPGKHLEYELIDSEGDMIYTHSSGGETKGACKDALDEVGQNEVNSLSNLDSHEGCVIFSTFESGRCALWNFEEGTVLWNKEGSTLSEMGDVRWMASDSGDDIQIDGDPVSDFAIGKGVDIKIPNSKRRFQLMLLRRYWEGTHPFELYAPVVCSSKERDSREGGTELDAACADQCSAKDEIIWSSGCFEQKDAPRGYEKIDSEEEFCEEEAGEAWCLCLAEKEYYWEVDEEYQSEGS